jgi:periplasmic divalent cation tolerance protein
MTGVIEVTTTTPTRELAMQLAESAMEASLAAGAQVLGPVASFFWHEGKLGQGEEWKVTFKTTGARYRELESHLITAHVWSNPEVTAVPLVRASASYVEWVQRVTAAEDVTHDA